MIGLPAIQVAPDVESLVSVNSAYSRIFTIISRVISPNSRERQDSCRFAPSPQTGGGGAVKRLKFSEKVGSSCPAGDGAGSEGDCHAVTVNSYPHLQSQDLLC